MEPPIKGHFGDTASVLIMEVVPFSEVKNILMLWVKGPGGVSFVGLREVVPNISEGPLLEVPLYICSYTHVYFKLI